MKREYKAIGLLALLAAGAVLSACGADTGDTGVVTTVAGNENGIETEAVVDTAELTELQKRQRISDNLPEKDWGGKEFRIITGEEFDFADELWVEEQNGDQCNDAVYNRNEKIESRFNVKISLLPQGVERTAPPAFLKTIVLAGDDAAELAAYVDYMAYTPVGAGVCMD